MTFLGFIRETWSDVSPRLEKPGDRTTDVRPPGAEALGTAGRRGPGGSLHGTTGHGCTGVSEHLRAAVLGAPQYPGAYFQEPPGSHRRKKRKERKRNHQSPWPQALSFLQNKGLWCGEKTSQIILALPHPGPWLSGLTQGGERKGRNTSEGHNQEGNTSH